MFNSKTGVTKLGLLGATALLFAACGGSGGSSSAPSPTPPIKNETKTAVGTVSLDESAKTVKVVADGKTYEGHFSGVTINHVPQINQPTVIDGAKYKTFYYKGKGDYLIFGGDSFDEKFVGQSGTRITPTSLTGTKIFKGAYAVVPRLQDRLIGNAWGTLDLSVNMDASTVKSIPKINVDGSPSPYGINVDAKIQGEKINGSVTYSDGNYPDLSAPLDAGFYQGGADGKVELNGYFSKTDVLSGILFTTEQ